MVGVEHRLGKQAVEKEVQGDVRFLLTNRDGSYVMMSSGSASRYDGFFVFDDDMYKIVDFLGITFNNIVNKFDSVELDTAKVAMAVKKNCLIINPETPMMINLDVRKSYDMRQWGRFYEISEKDNEIIIKFTKRTDSREDSTHDEQEYTFFVVVMHNGTHKIIEKWVKAEYPYDRERGSGPFERHVFQALGIEAKKIVVAAAKDIVKAELDAREVFKKFKPQKPKISRITNKKEINIAYNSALFALDNLMVNGRIFAGLPWFFQYWTRDEAIAVGALISQKRYKEAKDILWHELSFVSKTGRIPSRVPESDLESADSTGWSLFRISQLFKKKQLDNTELVFLKAKLEYILSKTLQYYVRDNLVYNNAKETWMDTTVDGKDQRIGPRVEIQALQLALYKFAYQLSQQDEFIEYTKNLKDRFINGFWDGNWLADGLHDFTIRPNMFIAYYVYPELLSKKEWIKCFDVALERLWLDWGGLTTIDKKSPLFQPKHTGENNISYHRGDSWYWINNLAALCMHRLDKEHYKEYIDKILNASTNEILWMGAVGTHAEISSAFKQESRGCFSQAWSLGMYIELTNELFG